MLKLQTPKIKIGQSGEKDVRCYGFGSVEVRGLTPNEATHNKNVSTPSAVRLSGLNDFITEDVQGKLCPVLPPVRTLSPPPGYLMNPFSKRKSHIFHCASAVGAFFLLHI